MDGNREVLGVDVGDSEDEVFWTTFLRSLRERGLSGVRLVISDAHAGLKAAIARVFSGATWQRCKVHTMRNVLAAVPAASKEMVAATVRTIFAQGTPAETTAQLRQVVTILENQFPKAAETLAAAEVDVCAYATFPRAHWRKIASTNPLERINKEIKRRSNVVGIFPDDDSVIRLVGAVLVDQHDEWQATDRRYLSEGSMALIDAPTQEVTTTHLQRTHRRVTSQRTPRVTPSLPPLHSVSCWWGQREADDRAAGSLNHSVPFVARSRLATSSTMWTGRRGLIGAWYRPH
jgi:transposase-like protein